MGTNAFTTAYPYLSQLLGGSDFNADVANALEVGQGATAMDNMREALEGGLFNLNELMWLICGAAVPELTDPVGAELECNLGVVVKAVGLDSARAAYRDKLLVNDQNTLEDVRYEIAVTAKACAVLDPGSVELEKPIPNATKNQKDWKNSDIFGTFQKQPVRIEVTVLHESLPPAIHVELDDLVKQAKISSGFSVTLRSVLVDKDYAERVCALLELLHACHDASGGKDEKIDGVCFKWKKGAYHCCQETSPFENICFYSADEFIRDEKKRDIIHPCSVRSVTPKYILDDHTNPPGVVTFADLPNAPTQVPVSTKIHQILDGKLRQCEDGVINIVAFGNPLLMHDSEVVNAVRGSEFVSVPFWTDKNGVRHSEKMALQRDTKAPFVPKHHLVNDDHTQFVEPFSKMSAVWHIRLGMYHKSEIISNPNASKHILPELVEALSDPSPPSTEASEQSGSTTPSPVPLDDGDQEEGIVWTEIAQNYVDVCGTLSEARSVLTKLEQTGLSLNELKEKVEQAWSESPEREKKTKYISPTNQEMAMTFVVDCGGYLQAQACLDAYAEDIQNGPNDESAKSE